MPSRSPRVTAGQAGTAGKAPLARDAGRAEVVGVTSPGRDRDHMLRWVGVATLSGAAGVAIGVLASLFFLTPADSTDATLESVVAPAFAEPATPSVFYGSSEASQLDQAFEALESAEIQRFLSRSRSTLADGQQGEVLPPTENLPTVTFASGVPAGDGEQTHFVAEGETLWDIASQYGVSVEDLAARNGFASDAWIATGDTLTIPVVASPEQP